VRAARTRILTLAAGLAAVAGLCGLGVGGTAAVAAASVAARPDAPATTVPGVGTLDAIACPSGKTCVAVGSNSDLSDAKSVAINAATGAVKTWAGGVAGVFPVSVACPAATRCVAVSDDGVESVAVANAAMKLTGTVKEPSDGIVAMGSIACAGSAACYAVGFEGTEAASTGLLVKISAAGKILSTVKTSGTGIGAIACPSASTCLLAEHTKTGELAVPLANGRLGAGRAFPAGTYVQAVGCYAAKLCYALGGKINTGGLERTDELFPLNPKTAAIGKPISLGGFSGDGLACDSATQCLLVGLTGVGAKAVASVVAVTKGKVGAAKSYPADLPFDADACATATLCYAVGPGKAANTAVVIRI
jgi:hypothetical protein